MMMSKGMLFVFYWAKKKNLETRKRDLRGNLESLSEKEIQRLVDDPSKKVLTIREKVELNDELKTFISYLNIVLESNSLEEINFLDKFMRIGIKKLLGLVQLGKTHDHMDSLKTGIIIVRDCSGNYS